jgi:hypothetical protein
MSWTVIATDRDHPEPAGMAEHPGEHPCLSYSEDVRPESWDRGKFIRPSCATEFALIGSETTLLQALSWLGAATAKAGNYGPRQFAIPAARCART